MTKIKNLLFKDKKRKTITLCSLMLVVVIMFSIILIPVFLDMNKSFKNNDELYSYMNGTWKYMDDYIIFENDKVYVVKDLPFYDYILDVYKTTKNIDSVKKLAFEDCIAEIKTILQAEESVSWVSKKGEVIIHPLGNCSFDVAIIIEIKKDQVLITDYTATGNEMISFEKISNDTNLIIDDLKTEFDKVKSKGFDTAMFLPDSQEFDQRLIDANLNTLFSMKFLSGLYQKTKELTISNTQYVGFDRMFDVIYQYMKDVPGFSTDAKSEILAEIRKGEVRDALKGTVIESKFTLYGVNFHVYYKSLAYPKNVYNTGYEAYTIMMSPGTISLN